MPYKGKAPLTISLIQPALPSLQIETITKETPIPLPAPNPPSPSEVVVARLEVSDVRDNTMKFVSKRSKQKGSRDLTLTEKALDLSGRHNECAFYLHYSSAFSHLSGEGVLVPRCWSIKAPSVVVRTAEEVGKMAANDLAKFTTFTLLLSDLKATVQFMRVPGRYLDYYQTVSALLYLAKFHSCHWESKDEGGTLWEFGGHGFDEAAARCRPSESTSSFPALLGERLGGDLGKAVRDKVVRGIAGGRKWRTVVHGAVSMDNLLVVPYTDEQKEMAEFFPDLAMVGFKASGRGYGVLDVAGLLSRCVEPALLTHEQREEEFLGIYFEQLGKSLREARKPPLPPGYKWEDCAKGYDLAVLDMCADIHAREGAEGGSEYAVWKCGAVVDALERKVGGSTEPTLGQWKSIIDRDL